MRATSEIRKKQRSRGLERQIRATAHHEAGHAVMAELLQVPYKSVSIVPTSTECGRVILTGCPWPANPDPFDARLRGRVEDRVMVLMAGFIAEGLYTGRSNNIGARNDQAATWELIDTVALDEREKHLHLEALFARCAFLMRRAAMRRSVRALARSLVECGTMRCRDVAAVVAAEWKAELRRRRGSRARNGTATFTSGGRSERTTGKARPRARVARTGRFGVTLTRRSNTAMTLTSKGQVTIPQAIREKLGLRPGTRVVFDIVGNSVRIRKAATQDRGADLITRMREAGRRAGGPKMTTDEIMALTRGE